MDQAAGERIAQRALAPLPDLSTIVFFRKANRDFVTGRGPFAAAAGPGVRRFIRWGMWLFIGTGLATSLAAGGVELYLRQTQQDDLDAGYIVAGPVLLFLGVFYWMVSWFQARRVSKERRLAAEGGLLPAELIKAKYYSGGGESNTPSLRIDCRFKAPDGQTIDKRQSLSRFDANSKTVPPAGSTILILYVDNELFEAL